MLERVVDDGIWIVRQPLKFGPFELQTTMTVVRLQDASLWVHSPVSPVPPLRTALDRLGVVRHVVAPNRSHHLYARDFLDAYPNAQLHVACGLATKRPDLASFPELDARSANRWAPDLEGVFVDGLPVLNETVWFHRASGTLVVADLLFRFSSADPALTRLAGRLLGVYERVGMSRTMKTMVKDVVAFRRSIDALLSFPVRRVILAHARAIETDVEALRQSFAWPGDRRTG